MSDIHKALNAIDIVINENSPAMDDYDGGLLTPGKGCPSGPRGAYEGLGPSP